MGEGPTLRGACRVVALRAPEARVPWGATRRATRFRDPEASSRLPQIGGRASPGAIPSVGIRRPSGSARAPSPVWMPARRASDICLASPNTSLDAGYEIAADPHRGEWAANGPPGPPYRTTTRGPFRSLGPSRCPGVANAGAPSCGRAAGQPRSRRRRRPEGVPTRPAGL